MQRCPNCRARYQDGTDCRRCGMDLSQLLAAERAADRLARQALARLAAGDARAAADSLSHADALRRDPFLDLLLGFARSLLEAQPSESSARGADRGPLRPPTVDWAAHGGRRAD